LAPNFNLHHATLLRLTLLQAITVTREKNRFFLSMSRILLRNVILLLCALGASSFALHSSGQFRAPWLCCCTGKRETGRTATP